MSPTRGVKGKTQVAACLESALVDWLRAESARSGISQAKLLEAALRTYREGSRRYMEQTAKFPNH